LSRQMVLDEFAYLQREAVRVFDILRNTILASETDHDADRRPPLRLVAAPPPVYGKFADAAGGTSAVFTPRLSRRNTWVVR
jgi:hypothetical protein